MNIAIVIDGKVTAIGDYRALFPTTSFPDDGPDEAFLLENHAMRVNSWLPYDSFTQKLVACSPYISGDWVYTVRVEPLTPEDIAARDAAKAAEVRADRNRRLLDCDWTQLPDAPVDRTAWATYRQELREVTNQPGFPWNVVWPTPPSSPTPTVVQDQI